jgi:hypothetical protein
MRHSPSADCLHVWAPSSYGRWPRCSWQTAVCIWTNTISGTNRTRGFMIPRVERRKSLSVFLRALSHPLGSSYHPLHQIIRSQGYRVSPLRSHGPALLPVLVFIHITRRFRNLTFSTRNMKSVNFGELVQAEGLRKTTKYISQYSQCPGRDSNRKPPEYEPKALLVHEKPRWNP